MFTKIWKTLKTLFCHEVLPLRSFLIYSSNVLEEAVNVDNNDFQQWAIEWDDVSDRFKNAAKTQTKCFVNER